MSLLFKSAFPISIAISLLLAVGIIQTKAQDSDNVEILRLSSTVFQNTRSIRVLLPPGYKNPENRKRRYPVMYFNDGSSVFSAKPNGLNIEKIVYGLYAENKLPHLIIVGIDNGAATDKSVTGVDGRAIEYLPYPDVGFAGMSYDPDPAEPKGKLYPQFLLDEVIALVKYNYRIKDGAANTGLAGFSYGGVAALYTAMKHPDKFGKLLIESTPLWIGRDYQLLKDVSTTRKWPQFVSVGGSTKESDNELINAEGSKDQKKVLELIEKNSPRTKINHILSGTGHGYSVWRGRIEAELRFLFPVK